MWSTAAVGAGAAWKDLERQKFQEGQEETPGRLDERSTSANNWSTELFTVGRDGSVWLITTTEVPAHHASANETAAVRDTSATWVFTTDNTDLLNFDPHPSARTQLLHTEHHAPADVRHHTDDTDQAGNTGPR